MNCEKVNKTPTKIVLKIMNNKALGKYLDDCKQ